jgi:hypothetical protein
LAILFAEALPAASIVCLVPLSVRADAETDPLAARKLAKPSEVMIIVPAIPALTPDLNLMFSSFGRERNLFAQAIACRWQVTGDPLAVLLFP